MSDHEAFLQAIRERPDDDAPRLMYADWLTERGDPRGEFIRVQVALAQMREDDPSRRMLERREAELLEQVGPGMIAELPEWARTGVKFRRGMVAEVEAAVGDYTRGHAELARVARLEGLRVWFRDGEMGAGFVHTEEFVAGLRSLMVRSESNLDPLEISVLTSGPYLKNLVSLALRCYCLTAEAVRELAPLGMLKAVTTLDLCSNHLDDEAVEVIARQKETGRLHTLDLSSNRITNRGIQALAASPNLRSLRRLFLAGNNFTWEGAHALVTASWWSRLEWSDLHEASQPAQIRLFGLLCGDYLPGREDVVLGQRLWGEGRLPLEAVQALCQLPQLSHVRSLDLGGCHLRFGEVQALAESLHLGNLVELSLANASWDEGCLELLLDSPRLQQLRHLDLRNVDDVGDEAGPGWLAVRDARMPLQSLDLSQNWVFPRDLAQLASGSVFR